MPVAEHLERSTGVVTPRKLAGAALPVLRSFAALADSSFDAVVPRLTLQQYRALTVLREQGPQTSASLAKALGIAPSTLTRLGNRLVRDGLVARSDDPDDRRTVLLSATAEGARTADQVKAWRLAALAKRLGRIAVDDRQNMLAALELCAAVLDEEVNDVH